MAEWTYVGGTQIVQPGEAIIFNQVTVPCPYDLVLHRNDSGSFLAKGRNLYPQNQPRCCCQRPKTVNYNVTFGANVAIPTGGTVAPILVAISVDGTSLNSTEMISTPAAAEEFNNISRETTVPIWKNCCQSVSVRNIGTTAIEVSDPVFGMDQLR